MIKRLFVLSALSLTLVACSQNDTNKTTTTPTRTDLMNSQENVEIRGDRVNLDEDLFRSDSDKSKVTPIDQGENAQDREITQKIRQEIVANDNFSFNAKNVQIITRFGDVTLKGRVNTAQEKQFIVDIAKNVNGVKNVSDQLEVAPK